VYSCDNVDRNGHNNDPVLQANLLQPGDQRIQHTYEHCDSPHPSAAENTKTDPRRDGRSSTKQSAFFESDTDTGLIGAGINKNKAVAADFVLREDRKRRWVSHAESIGNNINNALAAERGIFHVDNDLGETQDLQIYWASNEGYSDTSINDDPNDEEHTTKNSFLMGGSGNDGRPLGTHGHAPPLDPEVRSKVLAAARHAAHGPATHYLTHLTASFGILPAGIGSESLYSGITEEEHTEDETADWPWYVPNVRKVDEESMKPFLNEAEAKIAYTWLRNGNTYRDMLRRIPKRQRSTFNHTWPEHQTTLLVNAGIIKKTTDTTPTSAWVKIFPCVERAKRRKRIIIEPRAVNKAYRLGQPLSMNLPTLADIEQITLESEFIQSIDFQSFFYQIVLHEDVRRYFRAKINQETYDVCVLPQGACFSPFIAQMFACAVARSMFPNYRKIVYIDNIYVSRRTAGDSIGDETEQCPFQIGSRSWEAETNILGVLVSCKTKTISLTPRFVQSMKNHTWKQRITYKCVFTFFGKVMYAARVLHIALCTYRPQMMLFSELCGEFFERCREDEPGNVLQECVGDHQQSIRKTMDKFECTTWGPYEIPLKSSPPETITFTDASQTQGAVVEITNEGSAHVSSWQHKNVHESINVKELQAIWVAVHTCPEPSVHIVTDSLVAVYALLKGWSKSESVNREVNRIMQQKKQIWISWVASEHNVADGPSRGEQIVSSRRETISITEITPAGRLWYHAVPRCADTSSQKNVVGDLYRLRQYQKLESKLNILFTGNDEESAVCKAFQNKKGQGGVSK
jgi:hypothetical protein